MKVLLLFLIFCLSFAEANDATVNHTAAIQQDTLDGQLRTTRELACLQAKLNNQAQSPYAKKMATVLTPYLERAFRYNEMGPKERALFYSQVMVETSYLNHFVETKNLKTPAAPGPAIQQGHRASLGIVSLINASDSDQYYTNMKPNARHSSQMGDFRGRGLIQNTRCDNYISTLHYMNMQYRSREPVWRSNWYTDSRRTQQISTTCSSEQIRQIKQVYKDEFGWNLDLFGILSDPVFFTTPGVNLDEPSLALNNAPGERIMVDAAMAFWKGRCGKSMYQFLRKPKSSRSDFCPDMNSRHKYTETQIISLCATKCVKGSTGSWEKRNAIFEKALTCTR